ncbi:MAG: extracellular solute-binding protein [Propionibacteriaceae bacterium]|nr:extracellular solute-binding protein [Propionibacteriaceae bacterium]
MKKQLIAAGVAGMLALSLAGCAGSSGGGATTNPSDTSTSAPANNGAACDNTITKTNLPQVTVWAWYPAFGPVVDLFNQTHDDVQICWTNAGQGGGEYDKFTTAIQAGTGAPDVIMLEFETLSSYTIQNALVDLTKYGINDIKSNFTAGAWKDASVGSGVYAVPVDGGPMGLLVRKDIFDKYNVPIPTTWDEFATAAKALKDAGYPGYITDWPSNGESQLLALYEQANAGASGFTYDAANPQQLGINFNTAGTKKVQEYWYNLVKQGVVANDDAGTTDYTTAMVNGTYASYISAAWGPGYLSGASGGSSDAVWQAVPLPQWDKANPVMVNWGGSSFAVTTQSKQPELAAKVAMGIYGDMDSWKIGVEQAALFPTYLPMLTSDYFKNLPYPFFNGQMINADVFLAAGQGYTGVVYSPFTPYVRSQLDQANAAMMQGQSDADTTIDNFQATLVQYAQDQGFTVTQG